jgi:hypothetical protein
MSSTPRSQAKTENVIAEVDPSLAIPRVKVTPDGALFHEIDAADGRCLMIP